MKQTIKRFSILTMVLIIAFLSATSISAQANYMTSFGLELNKPFTVPECSIVKANYTLSAGERRYEIYDATKIKSMCFQRDWSPYLQKNGRLKQPLPPLIPTAQIGLILPEYPGYVKRTIGIQAFTIDGNLAGIEFLTTDYKSDVTTLVSDLTEKYGKPTKITPIELQNDYGAKRTAYKYEWQLSGLSVIYDEYNQYVSIVTPPLVQLRIEKDKKNKPQNPL